MYSKFDIQDSSNLVSAYFVMRRVLFAKICTFYEVKSFH